MSEFFKKVATPETQGFRSAPDGKRSRDLQANTDAQRATGGFAGAIQSLLGATTAVAGTIKQSNAADKEERYKKHKLEIDTLTANSADDILRSTEQLIEEDGKEMSELTYEERKAYRDQATGSYMQQEQFLKKDFNDLIQERIGEKAFAVDSFLEKKAKKLSDEKNIGMLTSNAQNIFLNNSIGIDEKLNEFTELLDNNIGADKNIDMTRKEALDQIMLPMYQSVVATGDPKLVELLDDPRVKEFFKNADGYDNIMQMAKKKAISIVAATRESNFKKMEEMAYTQIELGGYLSKQDADGAVEDFLKDIPEGYQPSKKDIVGLKAKMYKGIEDNTRIEDYLKAYSGGDFSYLERLDVEPKEKAKIHLGAFKVLTGINGETPQDINEAMQSPQQKDALQSYLKNGGEFPSTFKDWAKSEVNAYTTRDAQGNEQQVSYVDAMRIKVNTYNDLSAMSAGTSKSINTVFDAKDLAKTMFYKNLIESIDSGSIDGGDARQLVTNFNTDLEKSVDSNGRFRSAEIDEIMAQGEVKEWATDLSGSMPEWTIDPFGQNTFDYATKTLVANASMFLAASVPIEEAKEMAENKFKAEHLIFESADGTETAIGGEFAKHFRGKEKAFDMVAAELPQLKHLKSSFTYMGNDWDFKRRISVRPTPDFAKTGQVEVWFDDGTFFNRPRRIQNTRMDYNTFNSNWQSLVKRDKQNEAYKYEKSLQAKRAKYFEDLKQKHLEDTMSSTLQKKEESESVL